MADELHGAAAPAPDADARIEGAEVLAMRVELDLVPEWSNVVERIARQHGERVVVGVEGGQFVIKVAVRPERKPPLMGDMERYWKAFVERRKKEGRWKA